MAIQQIGPAQCVVSGTDEPVYYVDLTRHPACECPDATWRETRCKHELAAAMLCGDEEVLVAYGILLQQDAAGRLAHDTL